MAGRVSDSCRRFTSSSLSVKFFDGKENLSGNGRADDESDVSIVSNRIAKDAVLSEIGKIAKILPIKL